MLMIVGAGGVLFCIVLGVKYATAEEPQEREKRKQALKTAIIGYVLIFVLIVALKLSIGPLTTWMNESLQGAQSAPEVKLDGK
jgi:NADH:ubiquinone oxidoreductase subunit 2 (subunit N)